MGTHGAFPTSHWYQSYVNMLHEAFIQFIAYLIICIFVTLYVLLGSALIRICFEHILDAYQLLLVSTLSIAFLTYLGDNVRRITWAVIALLSEVAYEFLVFAIGTFAAARAVFTVLIITVRIYRPLLTVVCDNRPDWLNLV